MKHFGHNFAIVPPEDNWHFTRGRLDPEGGILKSLSRHLLYVPGLLALLLISLSLVVVSGCTTNSIAPVSISTQDKLDWLNETMIDDQPLRGSGYNVIDCPVLFDTTLVQEVTPYGSQFLMVNGAEEIGFSLPYMAVKSPITLTIRVTKYQAPFGKFWMLDCGPDGTKFKEPLYVQPNSHVTSTSSSVLFYFNPDSGLWEVQQVEAKASPQLAIEHFSKYGISE